MVVRLHIHIKEYYTTRKDPGKITVRRHFIATWIRCFTQCKMRIEVNKIKAYSLKKRIDTTSSRERQRDLNRNNRQQ